MKLEDVLDDLCARFIINLPEEERSSFERLGFQVEQAFWFYDDFYRPSFPHLPRLNLRTFGKFLLQRYPPLIAPFGRNFDKLYEEFMAYKQAIPVCGAIILNETLTKCLLVKGWHSRSSWGFPKGKIGKDEDPSDCAVREVYEETGFDISSRIISNDYIDAHNGNSIAIQQSTRLFIIPGVPESTEFTPQTRKEISKIQWHPIESLPTKYGQDNSFYNVVNFVKKLKQWIKIRGQDFRKKDVIGGVKKKKVKRNNMTTNQSDYIEQQSSYNMAKQQTGYTVKKSGSGYIPMKQTGYNINQSTPAHKSTLTTAAANNISVIQDIFDKLRLRTDNSSPVNSILMRDNPSPIHLFEKLSIKPTSFISQREKVLKAIELFSESLKNLKINRSVIRESINKIC